MQSIPTLETARLIMRPYRLEDFDAYAVMWAEPEVARFIGGVPFTREASWSRFLRQMGMWQAMQFGFFALVDRDAGTFAGECGFHDLQRLLTPSIEGTMECGWGLVPALHGRGLAVEAMQAALAWADKAHPGLRRTCIIDPANTPSLRLAARLGFVEIARADYNGKPVIVFQLRDRTLASL